MKARPALLLALVLATLGGCKRPAAEPAPEEKPKPPPPPIKYAAVSGKVTLDGKPLARAGVTFQPIGSKDNLNPGEGSAAKTDDNGEYTLVLVFQAKKGAVVGKHRVEISTKPGDPQGTQKREFEVPEGGTKEANFALVSGD